MNKLINELKPLWKEYCEYQEEYNRSIGVTRKPTFERFFKWLMNK